MCEEQKSDFKFNYNNSCRIKDIFIELPNFERFHRNKNSIVGRDELINRLQEQIEFKKGIHNNKNRTVLVTGFRGVGKTSLVNKAIDELKHPEKTEKKVIRISLSQDNLVYRDILRLMIKGLINKYNSRRFEIFFSGKIVKLIAFLLFLSISFFSFLLSDYSKEKILLAYTTVLIIFFLLSYLNDFILNRFYRSLVELRSIEERIDSEVTFESNNESINKFGLINFNLIKKKKREYTFASDKELELDLLRTLKSMFVGEERHPPIFVFDEMDKIEPNYNFDKHDSISQSEGTIYTSVSVRDRQKSIAKILGNLKSFLHEAPITTIFIAGREMYDASLADIAARDSFYGSIFHDVIYVPSLLKSKYGEKTSNGFSKLIREILLRLMINEEGSSSLETFYNQIIGKYYFKDKKEEAYKIIFTLQRYITFLTYRSNGIPKKVIQLIENNVVREKISNEFKERNLLCYNSKEGIEGKRYFLKLDYVTQHKIGLISYLYRPYMVSHTKSSKYRSDKLLVGTSFLVDHLLKFHNQGFSWRNLELTPEILAINKEPELRLFIKDIMESLFKTHLRDIENGIHQYKFNSRLEHEIRFISRISPSSAAAFNFTLDESIPIKSHYKSKLSQLQKNSRSIEFQSAVTTFSFINNLLGDLHFFDKEYDDALINYNNSIRNYPENKDNTVSSDNLVFYHRISLKIALTYECMNSYKLALSHLSNLKHAIVEGNSGNLSLTTLSSLCQTLIFYLVIIEKISPDGIRNSSLIKSFSTLKSFLEKREKREKSIKDSIEVTLVKSSYFLGRGNVLFFKNGDIHFNAANKTNSNVSFLDKKKIFPIKKNKSSKNDFRPSISAFMDYMEVLWNYVRILEEISNKEMKDNNPFSYVKDYVYEKNKHSFVKYSGTGGKMISSIANVLSKIGDTLLTFIDDKELILDASFIGVLKGEYKICEHWYTNNPGNDSVSLKDVIGIYKLSSHLYEIALKDNASAFQDKKILYLIDNSILKINTPANCADVIHNDVFVNALRKSYKSQDNTTRPQILKFEYIIDKKKRYDTDPSISKEIYNNISTSIESKELVILYGSIKNKLSKKTDIHFKINHLTSTSSLYVRYLELRYYSMINLRKLFSKDNFKKVWDWKKLQEIPFKVSKNKMYTEICDNIFASYSILNLLEVNGVSVLFNHILFADLNWLLANWCQLLKLSLMDEKGNGIDSKTSEEFEEVLSNLFGGPIMHHLDPKQYLEKSKDYYELSLSSHSGGGGVGYLRLINKMYYLEDDFSDNFNHFSIALERFQINNGSVRSRLKKINSILATTRLTDFNYH